MNEQKMMKGVEIKLFSIVLVISAILAVTAGQDYGKAIDLSNKFYEAQRCGTLPTDNRVLWRKTSFLNDGKDNGISLNGGYFDAGDYVKFNFPMAYSMTVIAWGLIDFAAGYATASQAAWGRRTLKWGTDYFMKCHPSPNVLWGQVGNGGIDHSYWGRPEQWPADKARPSYKIDTSNPGSDLAAETAAALAAAAIVFKAVDPTYSSLCLRHAKELYAFANMYRKAYSDSITDAANYYRSWSGFNDELVWAAAWLFRATNDQAYLADAEKKFIDFGMVNQMPNSFDWDDKKAGVFALLYRLTKKVTYSSKLIAFCDKVRNGPKTPGGMVWLADWGPARHAANVAFIAYQAHQLGLGGGAYKTFAKSQIDYLLGKNPKSMSYLIGYGAIFPRKPHHRSSSCPTTGTCDWMQYESANPNPQILYGALVGGPDRSDNYADDRKNYQFSEVACDYNAAFQGACAAALML